MLESPCERHAYEFHWHEPARRGALFEEKSRRIGGRVANGRFDGLLQSATGAGQSNADYSVKDADEFRMSMSLT